jgi:hypothetical protein
MGPAGGFPRVQGRVIDCDAARHADTRSSKCMIVFSRLLGLTDTSPVDRTCIASNIYPLKFDWYCVRRADLHRSGL